MFLKLYKFHIFLTPQSVGPDKSLRFLHCFVCCKVVTNNKAKYSFMPEPNIAVMCGVSNKKFYNQRISIKHKTRGFFSFDWFDINSRTKYFDRINKYSKSVTSCCRA